jgi:hypothetical protein
MCPKSEEFGGEMGRKIQQWKNTPSFINGMHI